MPREKTDRLRLAVEIAIAICEANVYTRDSGLAINVSHALQKLPAGALRDLHTLVVLGNRWTSPPAEPERPERHIKNAPALLEDIGRQVTKLTLPTVLVRSNGAWCRKDPRLSCVGVRLYDADTLVLETDVGRAIEWIAGDVYFDENGNWAEADRAEVYTY